MRRFLSISTLALAVVALGSANASAQYVTTYSPPVVVAPPPCCYPPATVLYAPPPVTTYYAPPVAVYSPPVTVYAPPAAVVSPGVVTTRTYRGFGIFRPRGLYTESYYTPGVTTYYYPR